MKVQSQYAKVDAHCSDLESDSLSVAGTSQNGNLKKQLSWSYLITLHFLLLILCLHTYFLHGAKSLEVIHKNDDIYSPAAGAITIVTEQREDTHSHSDFTGTPNDQNTKAWDKLILPGFFNATAQEILAIGASTEDSVKVADGGYLASLHVYHDVHCLRRLRLWLYRDIYYPHIDPARVVDMQTHLDHCIETLRRNTMCRADTSVDTFVWTNLAAEKPAMMSTGMRKCVDWVKFEEWAVARKIDLHPYIIRQKGNSGA